MLASSLRWTLPYISLWHIQRGPGTVKTVPYSLFYIAMQTYKWSVGRNALIPPRRSLADCSNANLSEWNSAILRCAQDRSVACIPHWGLHCWTSFNKRELVGAQPLHFACAKTFCHSNTPQGCLLLAQTRTCRGAAPPSCYRKTVLSLAHPTGVCIVELHSTNANLTLCIYREYSWNHFAKRDLLKIMNLYSSPFFILTVAIGKTIHFQEISFISCIGKTKFLYFLSTVSLFVL